MKYKRIETPELIKTIEFFSAIKEVYCFGRKNKSGTALTLDSIAQVICECWSVTGEKLKSKVNHADQYDKESKYCFAFAAFFYSNFTCDEIAAYLGSSKKFVMKAEGHGLFSWRYDGKFQPRYIAVIDNLEKALPQRISELSKVLPADFQNIEKRYLIGYNATSATAVKDISFNYSGDWKYIVLNREKKSDCFMVAPKCASEKWMLQLMVDSEEYIVLYELDAIRLNICATPSDMAKNSEIGAQHYIDSNSRCIKACYTCPHFRRCRFEEPSKKTMELFPDGCPHIKDMLVNEIEIPNIARFGLTGVPKKLRKDMEDNLFIVEDHASNYVLN